nr:MAG TPA: hypothetical protein [Caudoviricetes sp.]
MANLAPIKNLDCVYPTWCCPSGTTSLCPISVARPKNPATMRAGRLSRHAPQPLKQTYVRCYGLTIVREIILYAINYIKNISCVINL